MELAYLKKACKYSGDTLLMLDGTTYIELTIERDFKDFWLVDDKYVFVGKYGLRGKFYEWG